MGEWTLSSHRAFNRLCANINDLNDSSLCFFVDFATNEASFEVTMTQTTKDIANVGIIVHQKHALVLQQKKAATLFLQLTRTLAEFHALKKMARRARSRGIFGETFQNASQYSKENCFHNILRPHAYHALPFFLHLENSPVDTPARTLSPSFLCKTWLAVPRRAYNGDVWNLMGCRLGERTTVLQVDDDPFEGWMAAMNDPEQF